MWEKKLDGWRYKLRDTLVDNAIQRKEEIDETTEQSKFLVLGIETKKSQTPLESADEGK